MGVRPMSISKHGSLVMSPFHITQPLGINGLLDGYYFWWCPIFPFYGTVTNPCPNMGMSGTKTSDPPKTSVSPWAHQVLVRPRTARLSRSSERSGARPQRCSVCTCASGTRRTREENPVEGTDLGERHASGVDLLLCPWAGGIHCLWIPCFSGSGWVHAK